MSALTNYTYSKSSQLYDRAKNVMPGGCSRNTILRKPHPPYVKYGKGCYVFDIEGNKLIDFVNNMASLIHGHAQIDVVNAVSKQLKKGSAFTMATEVEIDFAEHMCSRNLGFEKIRFVNSGTEAVMSCLKAARAFSGKPKIAKVEGSYHGLYDYAEVSQTAKPENWGNPNKPASVPVSYGTPSKALDDVVVIPFNNVTQAIKILNQHASELSCVLIDPLPHRVGLISASEKFITALSKWTQDNNALLVFDEVITFRTCYGGAQDKYVVKPDLTAMGKMIGGGFPVGALAGRSDVMSVMDPLAENVLFPHSGTFSANPITMTAGLVAMQKFNQDQVKQLNELGKYIRTGIREAIKIADVPVCVSGDGSMFRIHMKLEAPDNYRAAFLSAKQSQRTKQLIDFLFNNGVLVTDTCTGILSTAMTKTEADILIEIILAGLRKIYKS